MGQAMLKIRLCVFAVFSLFATFGCSHLGTPTRDAEKANIYLQMATDQFAVRDFNKSIESTLEALKVDPDLAPAYNHLALVYMETKRYPKSEEAFAKALQLQPAYPEVYNNMGVMYNRQERYMEAVTSFEKALAYDNYKTPENAYTNLGFAYFKLGDLARAKIFHQKALDVVPQFCLAEKNLGDVYTKEKNFQKASDYYEQAVTNCPLYQESQYKLGLVLMKMGQRRVAKNHFEKLIQKHKKGPYVDRSSEVLKYLR
jgi:type IV pilus assembly protein PilF